MMDIQIGQEWIIERINNILIKVLASRTGKDKINKRLQEGIAAMPVMNGKDILLKLEDQSADHLLHII